MALTILLIFIWVGIACIADVFFKNTSGFADIKFFCGLVLYAATAGIAVITFKRIEFGALIILWMAVSLLVGILISVFYYHEKFTYTTATALILTFIVMALIGKNSSS